VITNNINVVNTLLPVESIKVIAAGGVVRREDGGIVGDATASFVRQFKFDYAVIGASAIDEDGALLDFDFREVTVAQAIIESARSTILVADNMKFKRNAPFRIGDISNVDYIVTDSAPPPKFVSHCKAHGVVIVTTS
jgi:DeoR family glycerol-3-phosphate regulon repressor